MFVLMTFLFIVLILLFYFYLTRKRNYWKNKNVPHLPPRSVFGNYKEYLLMRKYIGHVTQELCQAFPDQPYVGIYYGTEPGLIVKDPEYIKTVLIKDFYFFNSREIADYTHKEIITQNIFFTYGDRWKVIRQNISPVFSSGKMKKMFHLIEKCCYVFEDLLDHETKMSRTIETRRLTARYAMDSICACAFGIDSRNMEKGSDDNPFYVIGQSFFQGATGMAIKWNARAMWPGIFYGLGFKTFSPEIVVFFKQLLKNVFKERGDIPSTRHDLVDYIIRFKNSKYIVGDSIMNSKKGHEKEVKLEVDDNLLVGQTLVMFLAGYETSSTTLAFTLFELAKNKEAQRLVQEEIDEFLRRHGNTVNYEVVNELSYTEACLNEALRLYPVLGIVTRECVEDYTFPDGLTVEKDTRVHIPTYYLHYDPDNFPEPKKFKPERFLPEQRLNIKPYTYMPFGEGPRGCMGERFAKMQMLAALLTILKKFDVELAEGMPREVPFDPRAFVTQPAMGIQLNYTPRPGHEHVAFAPRD